MNFSRLLKECSCCEQIRLPGECKARPFLQVSEMKLLELIGKVTNTLAIEELFVFPRVIKKIGDQEAHGFEAEYIVYEELKRSNLRMYVFYSLKNKKNEELGDFLLITKSSVIILDVKSFKLVDNPTKEDIKKFEKKLSDYTAQESRVVADVTSFLTNHDCKYDAAMIRYFKLFPNTTRTQISKQTDCIPPNILFKEDYLQTIAKLSLQKVKSDEDTEYTLRTLLAWFYGTYIKGSLKLDVLKPKENLSVHEELNREYKLKAQRINKEIAGIFLTPSQKVIVESNIPYLQIIGPPGTGKTFCLLQKMVEVFFSCWKLHQKQETKELIIVFHRSESTLRFIRKMFWQAVDKQLKNRRLQQEEGMLEVIRFIVAKFFMRDIDTNRQFNPEKSFRNPESTFKVFCDDILFEIPKLPNVGKKVTKQVAYVHTESDMVKVIDRSNFCWSTSYVETSIFSKFSDSDLPYTKAIKQFKYAQLTDSLRYTANIHSLMDVLVNLIKLANVGHSGLPELYFKNFRPGTRVIGQAPRFIPVKDYPEMKEKMKRLRQSLIKEENLQESEITVVECKMPHIPVHAEDPMTQNDGVVTIHYLSSEFESFNESHIVGLEAPATKQYSECEAVRRASLESKIPNKRRGIRHLNFPLRGIESNYVIVCVSEALWSEDCYKTCYERFLDLANETFSANLKNPCDSCRRTENYRIFDLIEAISRAISGVTVFYYHSDYLLCKIAKLMKKTSPSICTNTTYKKTVTFEDILKD